MLLSFSLALSCFGQGYNFANLPFLVGGAGGQSFINLRTLTNAVFYVDINGQATNQSGSTSLSPGDTVKGWTDISLYGTNPLVQLGGSGLSPVYTNHAGPTNGPCIWFTGSNAKMCLTNTLAGSSLAQPTTWFFVVNFTEPGGRDNYAVSTVFLDSLPGSRNEFGFGLNGATHTLSFYAGNNVVFNPWGGFGASWSVLTLQYSNTTSIIRLNGVQQQNTLFPGTYTFNTSTQSPNGVVLGNGFTIANPSYFLIAAALLTTGSSMTNAANMLQVEESLGHEFGITIP